VSIIIYTLVQCNTMHHSYCFRQRVYNTWAAAACPRFRRFRRYSYTYNTAACSGIRYNAVMVYPMRWYKRLAAVQVSAPVRRSQIKCTYTTYFMFFDVIYVEVQRDQNSMWNCLNIINYMILWRETKLEIDVVFWRNENGRIKIVFFPKRISITVAETHAAAVRFKLLKLVTGKTETW